MPRRVRVSRFNRPPADLRQIPPDHLSESVTPVRFGPVVGFVQQRERRTRGRGSSAGTAANPTGDPLFEALRARRRTLAAEASVPPYVIFHDSVLRDMATIRPATLRALGEISGIGARKLEAFGEAFLEVIREG